MVTLLLAVIYLSFISLGLPDALLGASWPTMYIQYGVPISYAGIISTIISIGTVISSLQSDRLTKRFGTGMVTAFSVGLTAIALFGFSVSSQFWLLFLWALPYGLGAGSVDASLNNYVAIHYASRHMSWLHCMWGVGISVGPYILSYALTSGMTWNMGYRIIFLIQIVLTVALILSLPLWEKSKYTMNTETEDEDGRKADKALSLKEIFGIKGAKEVMSAFFGYCALEQTVILWGSSYLVIIAGLSNDKAASFASLFCIGITIGRAISGFATIKFNDTQMIRIGMGIILTGVIALFLPMGIISKMMGLAFIGFGCAPIYPCIIHSTPTHFGEENSQAFIGVQMASAYVGITIMPTLFGLIAKNISMGLFPLYLLVLLLLMFFMYEKLIKIHSTN